jgi:hypothetical protein
MIEVIGGVKVGDKVVVRTPEKLREGTRIKIIEK